MSSDSSRRITCALRGSPPRSRRNRACFMARSASRRFPRRTCRSPSIIHRAASPSASAHASRSATAARRNSPLCRKRRARRARMSARCCGPWDEWCKARCDVTRPRFVPSWVQTALRYPTFANRCERCARPSAKRRVASFGPNLYVHSAADDEPQGRVTTAGSHLPAGALAHIPALLAPRPPKDSARTAVRCRRAPPIGKRPYNESSYNLSKSARVHGLGLSR